METRDADVIYIPPTMLQSVPKTSLRIDGAESMTGITDSITSIHTYTASNRKAIQKIHRTFAPIIELRRSDLEQLMYVKNDDGAVNLIGQIQGDNASELHMFASGDDEHTVINFSGNFSRRQLREAVTQDNRRRKQRLAVCTPDPSILNLSVRTYKRATRYYNNLRNATIREYRTRPTHGEPEGDRVARLFYDQFRL